MGPRPAADTLPSLLCAAGFLLFRNLNHTAGRPASQTVALMAPLWATDETVRGHDPAARVTARQEKSAAIVAALFALCEKELPKLSGKSKPAEAIRYALGRGAALERFLADGRIELDSNTVERAIRGRPVATPHYMLGSRLTELTTISGLIASAGRVIIGTDCDPIRFQ